MATLSMALTPRDDIPPDENVGPLLVGLSTVLVFFVLLTASLRLWVRFSYRNLGWDDHLMALLLPIAVARLCIQGVQLRYGNGRHRHYISEEDYVINNMLGWYTQHTLFAGMILLKCSIMFLLLRIKSTKTLRWVLGTAMVGVVVTNLGCIIILLAECRPISAYWTGVGKCWNTQIRIYAIYATIAYSLATDFMCSLLPLVVIWRVRLPLSKKILVCGLMSLGLIATGFGIARATSLGISTTDLSYVFAFVAIWSNMEFFLGIIATNLALSRQIYSYFFLKGTGSSKATRGYGANSRSGGSSSLPVGSGSYSDPFFSSRLRGDHLQDLDTFVVETRRGSLSKSDHSDIPLQPGIQKTTEFWLTEEDLRDRDGEGSGLDRFGSAGRP